jgi:HAD superfamily hydrolase (TIGR01509 family)
LSRPPTLLIFDCDGVLVDSELIALQILSRVMHDYGVAMSVAECRDAFMGRHNADIVRLMEARVGRDLPGEAARLRAFMMKTFEHELQPVPGAAAALAALPDVPRCVASSSDRDRVRQTLQWTGLLPFFGEAIFSGTEVTRGKPAPDLFLHAANSMAFAAHQCLVIEDSVAGVAAALAAGMHVFGFTGGAHIDATHAMALVDAGATAVLSDMAMVPDAVRGWQARRCALT